MVLAFRGGNARAVRRVPVALTLGLLVLPAASAFAAQSVTLGGYAAPGAGSTATAAQQLEAGTSARLLQHSAAATASSTLPIMRLNLTSASQIGPAEAAVILRGTGFWSGRNRTEREALKALRAGHTYYRKDADLKNPVTKQWLFEEYRLYRSAVERHRGTPDVDRDTPPGLYDSWVKAAAEKLTAVPAAQRKKLLRSLMETETGKVHWQGFKPVVSRHGAIGFGQLLPETARLFRVNPYDPKDNIRGIAVYLNELIQDNGVRTALAMYNGGERPPDKSFRYADEILKRAGMAQAARKRR